MRLMLGLSKAYSKMGLVPVKKLVSKKGKSYMQTFYVKQGEEPKPVKKVAVKEKKETKKTKSSGESSSYWNTPDGFYVLMGSDELTHRIKIPDQHIHGGVEFRGHKFTIARGLDGTMSDKTVTLGNWRAYDPKSGYAVTPPQTSIEGVVSYMNSVLVNVQEDTWNRKLDSVSPITSIKKVYSTPVEYLDPFAMVSDFNAAADKLMIKMNTTINEETGNTESVTGLLTEDQVAKWMETQIANNRDLRWLLEEDIKSNVLIAAVKGGISLDNAKDQEKSIDTVMEVVKYVFASDDITRDEVVAWAEKHNINLIHGVSPDGLSIQDDEYDIDISGKSVLAYAFKTDVGIDEAYAHYEGLVEEVKNHKDESNSNGFTDSFGHVWEGKDLMRLGAWVNGEVTPERNIAKRMFANREDGTEFDNEAYSDTVVKVVETHLTDFRELELDALYRGTFNTKWGDAKPGDVIPFGVASFSKSEKRARGFTHGGASQDAVILVMRADRTEAPIVGVDINKLVEDGAEVGADQSIHRYRIDEYSEEREFLLLAPSLHVLENLHENGTTYVYVEPYKMNLVSYMKSRFESRATLIEEMERTFDYPLHREPEGVWS